MKNVFRKMGRLIGGTPRHERETAYLNGATSIVDLELRMREIDGGRFRNRL